MRRPLLDRSRAHPKDLALWEAYMERVEVYARGPVHHRAVDRALDTMRQYLERVDWVAASWGKDSGAMLGLLDTLGGARCPVVHVTVEPVANPDYVWVRDRYLERFEWLQKVYVEISVRAVPRAKTGRYHTNRAYERGFAEAVARFGPVSMRGIRQEESSQRKLSAKVHGVASKNSVRPLLRWTAMDVFAVHVTRELPMAAVYGCCMRGAIPFERLRMNNLWGLRGEGVGRKDWEEWYYGKELAQIRRQHARDVEAVRGCSGLEETVSAVYAKDLRPGARAK